MTKRFTPGPEEAGLRLDVYLEGQVKKTRSQVKRAIDQGRVQVNGKQVKAGYKIKPGDKISYREEEAFELVPRDLGLEVIYEDQDLALINKPPGLLVHPTTAREEGTLVQGLLHLYGDLAPGSGALRPGIVHRLDEDTSGLMVIARTQEAFLGLVDQFKEGSPLKVYLAIVSGQVLEEGVIEEPIGRSHRDRRRMAVGVSPAKPAWTSYRPLEVYEDSSLLEVTIRTGRTHQIRVHLASVGHPVLGDGVYGQADKKIKTQALHAYRLGLSHPRTGEDLVFAAQPPENFLKALHARGSRLF